MLSEKLQFIMMNTSEMVRYAEAKNAVLLTLQGAGVATAIQILAREKDINIYLGFYLISGLVFLSIGLIVSLLSFFPITQHKEKITAKNQCTPVKDNLLFYAHIQHYTYDEYLAAVWEQYGDKKIPLAKYESDLVNSIIANSEISYRKYFYFKISLSLILVALLTPVAGLLILYLNKFFTTKAQKKSKSQCPAK